MVVLLVRMGWPKNESYQSQNNWQINQQRTWSLVAAVIITLLQIPVWICLNLGIKWIKVTGTKTTHKGIAEEIDNTHCCSSPVPLPIHASCVRLRLLQMLCKKKQRAHQIEWRLCGQSIGRLRQRKTDIVKHSLPPGKKLHPVAVNR